MLDAKSTVDIRFIALLRRINLTVQIAHAIVNTFPKLYREHQSVSPDHCFK